MDPALGNGKICYVEIPTTDIQRSADFYSSVFGWAVRKRGDGSMAFDDGVGQVSGGWRLDRKPHVSPPGLIVHVMVDDLEATMAAICKLGGAITQPLGGDAPELTAHFRDPDGNVFGLYQERH